MSGEKLKVFILSYINTRKQAKLDTFDKEAEKKRSGLSGEALSLKELELAQARRDIELKHEVRHWLTDAAIIGHFAASINTSLI